MTGQCRDWDAEGMPEAEILRRWKIVDSVIENYDSLVAEIENIGADIQKAADAENWLAVKYFSAQRESKNIRRNELFIHLSIGSDDSDD